MFGDLKGAKFENCHGSLFTLPQLLSVFVTKGKLIKEGDMLQVNPAFECACQHHKKP